MQAILTFHSVDASGSVLSIAPDELASLITAIRASGHEIVPLREIVERPERPRRVALSFDDGMASLYENALPLLRELAAPATLFLTTGWLGGERDWPALPDGAPPMKTLDWEQVRALHAAGWAIEAHTVSHPDLRELPDAAIDAELEGCDAAIEAALGERPQLFAYPFGYADERVERRVARRYRFALTAAMGTLPAKIAEPMRVPRLETYYFRAPRVHARFDGALFRGYLAGRAWLRRLRSRS